MAKNDWEFLEHVSDELPSADSYEDHMMAIEESVWADLEADADILGNSAEDLAFLFNAWKKQYPHERPAFRLPPPEAA